MRATRAAARLQKTSVFEDSDDEVEEIDEQSSEEDGVVDDSQMDEPNLNDKLVNDSCDEPMNELTDDPMDKDHKHASEDAHALIIEESEEDEGKVLQPVIEVGI